MNVRNFSLLFILILLFPENTFSQDAVAVNRNELLFNQYIEQITPYQEQPLPTILEQTALFFLETPYVAHTLDTSEQEELVINLHELDCVTFVENVLALSLTVREGDLSFDNFKNKLSTIRYRNNIITDYASRIHYTSDWIYENEKNGFLKNISQSLGGYQETEPINFMSSHRDAYVQLAKDEVILDKIKQVEKTMSDRGGFYYLPKSLIDSKASLIPHMAMVAFVTSIEGLDTTHVGFAFHKDDKLTFIHASSAKKEVVIDQKSLSDYCLSQKNCKGIIVAKVL